MDEFEGFGVFNAGYVAELHELYRRDPNSVDPAARALFERWPQTAPEKTTSPGAPPAGVPCGKIVNAVNYIESIRKFGYMDARIDPLGSTPPGDPSLVLASHGINEGELCSLPATIVAGSIADGKADACEVVRALRKVYCSTIGYDYAHLRGPEEREWLRQAAESGWFRPPADPIDTLSLRRRA